MSAFVFTLQVYEQINHKINFFIKEIYLYLSCSNSSFMNILQKIIAHIKQRRKQVLQTFCLPEPSSR